MSARGDDGWTPLMEAAAFDRAGEVTTLAASGAPLNG